MTEHQKVQLKTIPTGVPNLDTVLGGGIPAYSINMIAGAPGAGKTTLVNQILSHNATPEAKALYFVALGEPTMKLLRYQQQFSFFDPAKINNAIFYLDLSTVVREQGLVKALDFITQNVERHSPAFVVIDSFKSLEEFGGMQEGGIRTFVHDLGVLLGFWETTSFLIGEYSEQETQLLPEFSVADAIIWMGTEVQQNVAINKLRVIKIRGLAPQKGKHTYRITSDGIAVFPRIALSGAQVPPPGELKRVQFGIPGLDQMMHGGIPSGEATVIAGSTGTGKTLLSLHFMAEGIRLGEPCVMATFEEHPSEHERKATSFGWDLQDWQKKGLLEMIYLRPVDLSADVVLYEIQKSVERIKAKRVVINSVSGFELGLAATDREDFRESLYRLVANLASHGITTVLTTEIPDIYGTLQISKEGVSFLADNVILLRYVEIESQLQKVITVVKMRTSDHDKDLRQFTIGEKGVQVEQPFDQYTGVLSGIPTLKAAYEPQPYAAGLTSEEQRFLRTVMELRNASLEQVAGRTGVKASIARETLDRLAEAGYLVRSGTRDKPFYRVAFITPALLQRK